MGGTLDLSWDGSSIAILTINHPPANTFDHEMSRRFSAQIDALEKNLDVRCLIVTGAGERVFCAGEDIKTDAITPEDLDMLTALLDQVEAARMPVIAAINGFCAGGGMELAMCCDIRMASTNASFICAGVNVGAIGGTYRLPRIVGAGAAKEMQFTGERHDVRIAEKYGLVTSVHAPDQLMSDALKLARRIAGRAPLSVEAAKRQINLAHLTPAEIEPLFDKELKALILTEDHREALASFGEKREPDFRRC